MLPFGSAGLRELSGRLKTLVHQDPDTQNKAVHLMVERGAKWH